MNNKQDVLHIIGCLMKNTPLLSQVDKYNLTISDFETKFQKYIFDAISSLYHNGAKKVTSLEIEEYLNTNENAKQTFKDYNGFEFLQDAEEISILENFEYHYNRFKKINLLKSLQKSGFSIDEFYVDNPLSNSAVKINSEFEELTIQEIIDRVRKKILNIEKDYVTNDIIESEDIGDNIDALFEDIETHEGIGLPLQGHIFNEVTSGAQRGTFTLRSAASGVGKSRNMVGDACFLAFPIRYNQKTAEWEITGNSEKVLYIPTEQKIKEIKKMVLAYLTGINQKKFKYNKFSPAEKKIVEQAKAVMKEYSVNLRISRMGNPTNELVKSFIREECILNGFLYVFYDYIFICPSLLREFKGFSLRNDELLLILSTTLKDLAAELDVYVMSATQLNTNGDDSDNIRNESALAGGRSTINKADYGFIMARPTQEELKILDSFIQQYGVTPNLCTDVFKVRDGDLNQIRIWSVADLGTLRKTDLFVTDSRLQEPHCSLDYDYLNFEFVNDEFASFEEFIKELEKIA